MGVGAEQCVAKAAAEVGAVARGERGRARSGGDLDGGEERPGSGEELRGQRLDLRLGADRHGELEPGCRRDAGQKAFHQRARLNGLARSGRYAPEMEKIVA